MQITNEPPEDDSVPETGIDDPTQDFYDACAAGELPGLLLVGDERYRAIVELERTPEFDKSWKRQELRQAAVCYAAWRDDPAMLPWPFAAKHWRPGGDDPRGEVADLIKAAALLVAEIDRLMDHHSLTMNDIEEYRAARRAEK